MPTSAPPIIHVSQEVCRDVSRSVAREWLLTNGIGGFAMGTVAGCLTRRYHGLLIAALQPPLGRTLMLAKLDETLRIGDESIGLYANCWDNGIEQTAGVHFVRCCELRGGVPTWTFELAGLRLIKRIWMEHGQNTVYLSYELLPGRTTARTARVSLECRALVNHRDYHALTAAGDWQTAVEANGRELTVIAREGAPPLRLSASAGAWHVENAWYRRFHLPAEQARGFDFVEDHLCAGVWRTELAPGATVGVAASAAADVTADLAAARQRFESRQSQLLSVAGFQVGDGAAEPLGVRQLVLAADQFIVTRDGGGEPPRSPVPAGKRRSMARSGLSDDQGGKTILAGYPWFTDWGRDAMIALPGLTLSTGRDAIARRILTTFARHVDQGMIPNRFPDRGDEPEYNTADATLWYVWAVGHYFCATRDEATLAALYPMLASIVEWHRHGTRFGIRVDADGLLAAGQPGVQLTWMDAKVGDWVVTPRIGKPVELSALWHHALCCMQHFAAVLGQPAAAFAEAADATRSGFSRFWNAAAGCCFDVLDGPAGPESAIRPNQVFAISLAADRAALGLASADLLPTERARLLIETCERELLTWFGLRSLAPGDTAYRGHYAGDGPSRDAAYHQGTAWGWLLGPFALAYHHIFHDDARARAMLAPLLAQVHVHGLGSLAEVFDGDPPHNPNGCPAQAWSVAETLRAWRQLKMQNAE
ncbi:MAG: hypothetical protein CHACPFDD_00167 [Phycisphaerae bacterium]|nr:hypothetical protein [Phycisphaerae bacterium]